MKYFEIKFDKGISMACKGKRVPSIEEANSFYITDIEKYGQILSVFEIDFAEVKSFFDVENIDNWTIFE